MAYNYLYNAIESDKQLDKLIPNNNSYKAPAYLTATIKDDVNNHMYPLIAELRSSISGYIDDFNKTFGVFLSINDFDHRFLHNVNLEDIVYFFVYNFLYIFNIQKAIKGEFLQNEFSRLKSLDVFFNLCLIIDETLKVAYKGAKGRLAKNHSLSDSIIWLVESKGWMRKGGIEELWGGNYLNVNDTEPDILIPRLLCKSESFEGKPVAKQVISLIISYRLRNYGGHNIHQQNTFTVNYEDILRHLFYALFLSCQAL